LLIVLWTVVLLALLVTHLTATGRGETQLAANLRGAAVVEAAADGAVAEAIFHALDSGAGHWPADGRPRRIGFPAAVVELRLDSEAGRLNPNTAQPELLAALLHVVGADTATATAIAAAMVDWRFPDAQGRSGGAKAPQYRAAGRSYGPPGAPFRSVAEIGLVLGMTPALLARLAPSLSVFQDGEPDPRLADPRLLQAIREATGAAPPVPAGPPPERVVAITASATGSDGGAFVRRAVVRMGARAQGGLFEVLSWETPAP
jgi:general secretion pathway protein K